MELPKVVFFPGEDQIEVEFEKRLSESSYLIERTIRYKSGIQIELIQDFMGRVFHFSIKSLNAGLQVRTRECC